MHVLERTLYEEEVFINQNIETEKGLDMDVVKEISTLIDVISDKMWFLR